MVHILKSRTAQNRVVSRSCEDDSILKNEIMLDKRGLFEEAVNLRHVLQAGVE
jgi:hypothetical protein